jgi:serine/threonine-protein kinase
MDTQVADILQGGLVGGRYRVRDRVARRGAMSVHTATDERLGREVTLKVLHPTPLDGPDVVDRFNDQVRAIARLTHPNVVGCYDRGTHNGLPYLVTEHVPGRTLREILTVRGRLSPDEALAITEQMLAAMAAAHRAGLVHREVKPENVLVAESPSGGTDNLVDSVVKVADFGLGQIVLPSTSGEGSGALAPVAYVAPELVRDGQADARGDIYSTGIVLFEMLTGRVPYQEGTPAQVAWQHVDHDVPPPSTYAPDLPAAVDELVVRATRRDPAARPTDAGTWLAEVRMVRERVLTTAVRGPHADSTMVMNRLPATERPAWARLPAAGAARGAGGGWTAGGARRARRAPAPRQRMVLVAAGTALALLVLVGAWWFGFGRWMPAPDLLAQPRDQAAAEAQRLGLRVRFAQPRHSAEVGEGMVLAQDPGPDGRVARGGTLTLTLSLGPEITQVPNVIGAELEVARRQLEGLGLVVREGDPDYSSTVPEGRVLAVDPEVGSDIRPGDEVVVTLSRGRPPIDLPSLIGMHINQASNELQRLGLQAEVVEVENNRPAGEVVSQDPGPGSGAEPGDTVVLEVSTGPPTIPVPNVEGMPCDQAQQILTDAGFAVTVLVPGNRVQFQNPSGGTGLPPGSQVTILCL